MAAYPAGRHDGTTSRLAEATARFDDPRQIFWLCSTPKPNSSTNPGSTAAPLSPPPPKRSPVGLSNELLTSSWVRGMFTDSRGAAGAPDPAKLGRQLHFVYEGAGLAARMDHDDPGIAPSAAMPLKRCLTRRRLAQT